MEPCNSDVEDQNNFLLQMCVSNYFPTGTQFGPNKIPHNIHTCMYTSLLRCIMSKYVYKCYIKK